MKSYQLVVLVLCAAILALGVPFVHSSEKDKTSDEFRNQFVKNFRRMGLNTTVGDAMMLRILVEGTRARRGIEVGSATGFGAIYQYGDRL
jgi:hypothetical protein